MLFETTGSTLQLRDTPTRNLVLSPDRYVVLEELPDLTRGTTKSTKRYFVTDVCEDVVYLRGNITSNERVKFHTMFLRQCRNFIGQAAARGPFRKIIVSGSWQIPMCVEIAQHYDWVALDGVLVDLSLKGVTKMVDWRKTRPSLVEPPLVLVPQSV